MTDLGVTDLLLIFSLADPAMLPPQKGRHLGSMGRALRLHHPGSAFHIVARTQGHAPWFVDPIKGAAAEIVLTCVASAGARSIAFAVMDTHFHLLLFQGACSLGDAMQPVMRRLALLIQKTHGLEGHVFERRYRVKLCRDSEHLPNAILYVHRNPVKAGMCRTASEYAWSSARVYEGLAAPGFVCVDEGLQAFDPYGLGSVGSRREAYKNRLTHTADSELDDYWEWFTRTIRRRRDSANQLLTTSPHVQHSPLADLRDVAVQILRSIDRDVPADLVRSRYGGRKIAAIRGQLISALLQRGYTGVSIARYLHVSDAVVSKIRSAMRWASLTGIVQTVPSEDEKQVR